MIIRIIERVGSVNVQSRVMRVVRVYDRNIPSGITVDVLTQAGSLIVSTAASTPSELQEPGAAGLVLTSNPSEPMKMEWAAPSSGGGVIELTNKSGSNQEAGTVVINDADNDEAFETTSTLRDRRVIGVLAEAIDNNASGQVAVGMTKVTVKVQGNVSRGMWLIASATTGRAQADGYTKPVGAIGMALTAYSGGGAGTVEALIVVDHYLGASAGKAYFAGGYTTTYTNVAQVTSFITETTALTASANLSLARNELSGVSSSDKGFFAGGYVAAVSAVADKVTYSTDTTAAQASANLSVARRSRPAAVTQRGTKGYFIGGYVAAVSAVADKLTYSTDTTAAQASANLSAAREAPAGGGSSSKAYLSGGASGAAVATADKLTYSTDTTAAQASANLSAARYDLASLTDETLAAYFAGGNNGAYVATADKTPYSTDTNAALASANLSLARSEVAGANGSLAGFFSGGTNGSVRAVADKLTFSTDTTAALSGANLPTAVRSLAGVSALV